MCVCVCVQEQGSKAGVCETEQSVLSLSVSSACVVCFIYVDQSLKALSNSSISPTSVCVCNYNLWPLNPAISRSTSSADMKRTTDTKQEQNFIESVPSRAKQAQPITFFIRQRRASSRRCTTEKAQNCQEGVNQRE